MTVTAFTETQLWAGRKGNSVLVANHAELVVVHLNYTQASPIMTQWLAACSSC